MSHPTVNLQDSFLNQVRKENTEVELMLVNGATFRGVIRGFDNFTIVVHAEGMQHLVYKHSIAQLVAPKFTRSNHGSSGGGNRSDKQTEGKGSRQRGQEKKQPEKFNSLDLSSIKIAEDKPETKDKSEQGAESKESEPAAPPRK